MSTYPTIMIDEPTLERLGVYQQRALVCAAAGLIISFVAWLVAPAHFYHGYLIGFLFWLALALGSIGLTLLHHLVGGSWGVMVRRPLEAGATLILPLAAFFLPLAVGVRTLYPWAQPDAASHEEFHTPYLNVNFFLLRALAYFVFWGFLAVIINHWSAQQDAQSDHGPSRRMGAIAGPALFLMFMSATFAAVDWGMSLDLGWTSTIYGVIYIISDVLTTLSCMIVVCTVLERSKSMNQVVTPERLHDIGKLMLAFTMLWAYMSFSQFLIIWSGNLIEEIPWYLRRTRGGWELLVAGLMIFHFFLPFFLLLYRDGKRRTNYLVRVALWILAMRFLDLTWQVVPSTNDYKSPHIAWADIFLGLAAVVGIGGVCVWYYIHRIKQRPLVPLNDMNLVRVLKREGGVQHG